MIEYIYFHYAELIIFCVLFATVIGVAGLWICEAFDCFKRAKELDRDTRD